MARKKSSWISQFERKVAYDRDTCVTICKRYLLGEQLSAICSKPPMPAAQCFLSWVEYNEEARDIWNCARKFESDRGLAKQLGVPMNSSVSDWADAVYDKLEHGYSLSNYQRQAYTMPDWKKLYPLVGDPPVWSSENLQDYEDLLKEMTQLLKPRDLIELVYTKEMADAIWEEKRESREKNSVPERQYQVRLSEVHAVRVAEARQRNLPMPKQAAQEPASALDHIRGFRTGFKTYQALDRAQCRKKKRRDNAPRQIARWRDRFGGKAEVLPDRFVAELALAKRDGVLFDTQPDDILDGSMQADPSPVPCGDAERADPSPVPGCETVNDPLARTEEVAQAATSVALPDAIAQSASGADPANAAQSVPAADPANATESASGVAGTPPTGHAPEAVPSPAPAEKAAAAAPASCANGQDAPPLSAAQESAQTEAFPSLSGAAANAASSNDASGETPGAASQVALEARSAEVVPAEHPAEAQAAPSLPGAGESTPAPADDGAKAMPPPAPTPEVVQAAPSVGSSARSAALPDDAEAARRRVRAEDQQATGPAAPGANGQAAPPLAPAQETAQTTAAGAFQKKPAGAAPPRTPAHEVEINVEGVTARINWIDWLTGARRYPRHWLIKAGEKAFQRHFSSKCALLRKLVLECKMVAPDQLCPELAFLVGKLEPRRVCADEVDWRALLQPAQKTTGPASQEAEKKTFKSP